MIFHDNNGGAVVFRRTLQDEFYSIEIYPSPGEMSAGSGVGWRLSRDEAKQLLIELADFINRETPICTITFPAP